MRFIQVEAFMSIVRGVVEATLSADALQAVVGPDGVREGDASNKVY